MKTNFSVRSLLLFFAVVFTTLPVLLFGTLEVLEAFREGNVVASEMNRRAAHVIQEEIRGSLDQLKALIEGMSLQIDLKTLRPRAPAKVTKLLADNPRLLGLIILDSKAISVAAYSLNMDIQTGIDYSDRPQVAQVRSSKRPTVSGNLQGRATNVPAVVILVPLLDENNEIAGFISGGVSPRMLATLSSLGDEEYGVVTDSSGEIVISHTSKTSMTTPQLESMARQFSSAADGTHKLRVGNMDVDIEILSIEPIGWKVFVGVAPEFLTARSWNAIGRTGVMALVAAIFGMLVMSLVSLATARGMADIGSQLERMSAVAVKPISIPKTRLVPAELRTMIANFNQLLDRTARAKLAELEAISSVADSIFISNANGTITYSNEAGARIFGEVAGRNLKDFIDNQAVKTIFAENTPREWKGEVVIHKPDGTTFDGFLSSTPILDNGKVTSIVAIVQDITKEKAARESLVQSEKMITLGELVAGTSHELNNPLAIVTGYSDLLLEEEGLSSEQRAKIESIRKNALRASGVVHSLLAFARKRKPERVKTDVNLVVQAAAELKQYDLNTSGVQFEKMLAEPLPQVFADPNQLQQVLLNVINNAQDAVLPQRQPRIVIRTEVRGDMVLITIEDNGAGISKADLKKVFDPFFTTKSVGKGTGLGLSISYGIIREHNGDITIQSEIGEGTQVTIELPIERGELASTERPSGPAPVLRSMRILVVDDETDIVAILRAGLTRPGVTVDSAVTISDALSLAGTINYDFVLTDVKMPGGSGIDLYKKLCLLNSNYGRRTVFLTGDTSNPATLQFLERENLPYFAKPFNFQVMDRFLRQMAAPK